MYFCLKKTPPKRKTLDTVSESSKRLALTPTTPKTPVSSITKSKLAAFAAPKDVSKIVI